MMPVHKHQIYMGTPHPKPLNILWVETKNLYPHQLTAAQKQRVNFNAHNNL